MARPKTDHRPPGWTLYRHILQEVTAPSLLALLVLTLIFLTDDMLQFSDLVMNRGLGAGAVASTALYRLIPAFTWVLPFSVLMGSLIALGRLGADRELLIIEASGISAPRLLPPILLFSAVATLLSLVLSVYASPWANRSLDATLEQLAREKPWATIQQGQVHEFGGWKLRAREVSPGGDRLEGVQIWSPEIGETIFAERAALDPSENGAIRLTLEGATILPNPRTRPRQLRVEKLTTDMPASGQSLTRRYRARLAGLTPAELTALDDDDSEAELQRRYALPAATLLFGALAVPLFLSGARFSRSGGWLLGIASTLVYYGLVQLGNGLIEGRTVSPALGIWLPNIAFGAVTLVLALRLTRMSAFGRHLSGPAQRMRAPTARRSRRPPRRRALPRYVAGRFLELALIGLAAILAAYLIVDVLERVERFARYQAGSLEVLRFYAARIPLLSSRVIPMSLLVATALTVSLFGASGELTAMRSCGIPAPRGLLPILGICAAIVPLYFLLNNDVIPRTNAIADAINDREIKGLSDERRSAEVWYREGNHFYEADLFDPRAGVARNITVYELGPDGLPLSRADARRGRHVGNGLWRLRDYVRVETVDGGVRRVPTSPFARLGDEVPENVDTRHLSVQELREEIRELQEYDVDATAFEVDFYQRLAGPFACLVLPALALFFALRGPPYPSITATLVFSGIVAVSYTLLVGLGVSLGYGKTLGPAAAGFAPVGLFAGAAAYLGLRLSVFR